MILLDAIKEAIDYIDKHNEDSEERGGVFMVRGQDKTGEYQFIPIRNSNTGTSIAPMLWTADRDEYGKKVCPLFREGWKQHASFHSHPRFSANPSRIDLTQLFQGFKINYIYSPSDKTLGTFIWDKGKIQGVIQPLHAEENVE